MRKFAWIAAIAAFPLGVASAAPQIKVPACDVITAWAAQVNNDSYNVAPRITLPKAFQDADLVPVFGVPALAWSQDDIQAASQALVACYQDAGKRRDQASAGALANANRALLGLLPRTNAALQKAKTDSDAIGKELDAMPASADLGRGIDILTKGNPGQPDLGAVRSLPREIADPIWRLAQAVMNLSDADRAVLWQTLEARRKSIDAGLIDDATKQIAAAQSDAGGLIALTELRLRVAAFGDADAKTKLIQAIDSRAKTIRDALRQTKPAVWVPPTCLDLYRWSSAPGAATASVLGRRSLVTGFLDERSVPVFGLPVAEWSDNDIAQFKTLRMICHTATLPQTAAVAPDMAELMQTANRGRWIDGADQQIADARTSLIEYRKAQQDLAALRTQMDALPNTAASILNLAVMANNPVLAAVSQDDRVAFTNAINQKRAAIGAAAADAAVKGLDGIKVSSTADLAKLFAYASQTMPMIPDQRGQQVFAAAFNQNLDAVSKRLLPDFTAQLASAPATADGLAQVKAADTAIGDGGRVAAFKPFHDAAHARSDAIVKSVHDQACSGLLSSLGVGGDASQDVWDGEKGMKLGDFICGLAEHGVTVNSYSGAGMFSSTSTLKLTPIMESVEIVSMHKTDVKAGQSMLVGYKIVDANGQQISILGATGDPNGAAAVSILGWEFYSKQATADSPNVVEGCKPVMAAAAGETRSGTDVVPVALWYAAGRVARGRGRPEVDHPSGGVALASGCRLQQHVLFGTGRPLILTCVYVYFARYCVGEAGIGRNSSAGWLNGSHTPGI